jgi:hypothetical protein
MGVTIIGVLAIIAAVVTLLGTLPYFGVGLLSSVIGGTGIGELAAAVGIGAGIVMLIVAIAQLTFGIGALQLKSWAWTLGVVLFVLSAIMYAFSMLFVGLTVTNVIGGIVAIAVLGYLFTHEVRAAFGHEPETTTTHRHTPSMTS